MRNKFDAIRAIEAQLVRNPDLELKRDLEEWLADLERRIPINPDVVSWMRGEWSPLCCLVD